jgi:hypothetical protein
VYNFLRFLKKIKENTEVLVMKKMVAVMLLLFTIGSVNVFAKNGKQLAIELGLDASSKATRQWERVFSKERKMKKYGIDKLSDADKGALKEYLIQHAADSDHPEAAGM